MESENKPPTKIAESDDSDDASEAGKPSTRSKRDCITIRRRNGQQLTLRRDMRTDE